MKVKNGFHFNFTTLFLSLSLLIALHLTRTTATAQYPVRTRDNRNWDTSENMRVKLSSLHPSQLLQNRNPQSQRSPNPGGIRPNIQSNVNAIQQHSRERSYNSPQPVQLNPNKDKIQSQLEKNVLAPKGQGDDVLNSVLFPKLPPNLPVPDNNIKDSSTGSAALSSLDVHAFLSEIQSEADSDAGIFKVPLPPGPPNSYNTQRQTVLRRNNIPFVPRFPGSVSSIPLRPVDFQIPITKTSGPVQPPQQLKPNRVLSTHVGPLIPGNDQRVSLIPPHPVDFQIPISKTSGPIQPPQNLPRSRNRARSNLVGPLITENNQIKPISPIFNAANNQDHQRVSSIPPSPVDFQIPISKTSGPIKPPQNLPRSRNRARSNLVGPLIPENNQIKPISPIFNAANNQNHQRVSSIPPSPVDFQIPISKTSGSVRPPKKLPRPRNRALSTQVGPLIPENNQISPTVSAEIDHVIPKISKNSNFQYKSMPPYNSQTENNVPLPPFRTIQNKHAGTTFKSIMYPGGFPSYIIDMSDSSSSSIYNPNIPPRMGPLGELPSQNSRGLIPPPELPLQSMQNIQNVQSHSPPLPVITHGFHVQVPAVVQRYSGQASKFSDEQPYLSALNDQSHTNRINIRPPELYSQVQFGDSLYKKPQRRRPKVSKQVTVPTRSLLDSTAQMTNLQQNSGRTTPSVTSLQSSQAQNTMVLSTILSNPPLSAMNIQNPGAPVRILPAISNMNTITSRNNEFNDQHRLIFSEPSLDSSDRRYFPPDQQNQAQQAAHGSVAAVIPLQRNVPQAQQQRSFYTPQGSSHFAPILQNQQIPVSAVSQSQYLDEQAIRDPASRRTPYPFFQVNQNQQQSPRPRARFIRPNVRPEGYTPPRRLLQSGPPYRYIQSGQIQDTNRFTVPGQFLQTLANNFPHQPSTRASPYLEPGGSYSEGESQRYQSLQYPGIKNQREFQQLQKQLQTDLNIQNNIRQEEKQKFAIQARIQQTQAQTLQAGGQLEQMQPQGPQMGRQSQPISTTTQQISGQFQPISTHAQQIIGQLQPISIPAQQIIGQFQPISTPTQQIIGQLQPISIPAQQIIGQFQPISTPTQQIIGQFQPISTPTQQISAQFQPISTPTQQISGQFQQISTPRQQINAQFQPISTPTQQINAQFQPISTPIQQISDQFQQISTPTQQIIGQFQQISTPTQQICSQFQQISTHTQLCSQFQQISTHTQQITGQFQQIPTSRFQSPSEPYQRLPIQGNQAFRPFQQIQAPKLQAGGTFQQLQPFPSQEQFPYGRILRPYTSTGEILPGTPNTGAQPQIMQQQNYGVGNSPVTPFPLPQATGFQGPGFRPYAYDGQIGSNKGNNYRRPTPYVIPDYNKPVEASAGSPAPFSGNYANVQTVGNPVLQSLQPPPRFPSPQQPQLPNNNGGINTRTNPSLDTTSTGFNGGTKPPIQGDTNDNRGPNNSSNNYDAQPRLDARSHEIPGSSLPNIQTDQKLEHSQSPTQTASPVLPHHRGEMPFYSQSQVDSHHRRLLEHKETKEDSEFESDPTILQWYLQRAKQVLHKESDNNTQAYVPSEQGGNDAISANGNPIRSENVVSAGAGLSYANPQLPPIHGAAYANSNPAVGINEPGVPTLAKTSAATASAPNPPFGFGQSPNPVSTDVLQQQTIDHSLAAQTTDEPAQIDREKRSTSFEDLYNLLKEFDIFN